MIVSSSLGECVEVFESYRDDVDRECNDRGSSFLVLLCRGCEGGS